MSSKVLRAGRLSRDPHGRVGLLCGIVALVVVVGGLTVFGSHASAPSGENVARVATSDLAVGPHPMGAGEDFGLLGSVGLSSPYAGNVVTDPVNGWAYVGGDNNITVLNGTTVVATLQTGCQAGPGTFDPATGWVYFALSGNEQLLVINGTRVIGMLAFGAFPAAIAYDAVNEHIYLAVEDETVTIISNLTETGSVSISALGGPTPAQPVALAYDSENALMYVLVGNVENSTVALLNETAVVADIVLPAGSYPSVLAYDPVNGFVYVADYGTHSVSVLNGTSSLATVSLGKLPDGLIVDNSTGTVYLFGYGSSAVTAITVNSGTVLYTNIAVGFDPTAGTYDGQTGFLCFVGTTNNSSLPGAPGFATLVNGTSILANFSINERAAGAAFDPANGLIYVPLNLQTANQTGIADVLGSGTFYNVTVTESGLPAGILWFVNESGVGPFSSVARTMFLGEQNGTFRYTASSSDASLTGPPAGAFTVDGKALSVTLTFAQGRPVVITEKGLPTGMEWWANFTVTYSFSSTATTMSFSMPAGTWTYTLHAASADYFAKGRTFTVHGPLPKSNTALKFTAKFKLETFGVTATETGLPHGSKWCLGVTGGGTYCSSGATVKFKEANGTYSYTLTTKKGGYTGAGGSFTVAGAGKTVPVTFTT